MHQLYSTLILTVTMVIKDADSRVLSSSEVLCTGNYFYMNSNEQHDNGGFPNYPMN